MPYYSPAKVEVWAPHLAFAGVDRDGVIYFFFPEEFDWNRVVDI